MVSKHLPRAAGGICAIFWEGFLGRKEGGRKERKRKQKLKRRGNEETRKEEEKRKEENILD